MDKILIIEDDKTIHECLKDDLGFEGFDVSSAFDGEDGLNLALEQDYQLIVLDLMLPRLNGLEICKRLREAGKDTPILMLTAARTEEADKIRGFELGADDYVTKPVGSRELVARVRAILKRATRSEETGNYYRFGDVEVNFKSYEVTKTGKLLHLTALEFSLLKILIERRGEVLSRDDILDMVWNDYNVSPRTVDTHITHLRKKIENEPSEPEYIIGIRSVGYKFVG